MSHQTIQHYHASPNKQKIRLISRSKCLSWKAIIASSIISLYKWLLTLLGALALSGYTSEHPNDQSRPAAQPKESASFIPVVHKEFGEASWYGPGFHGRETSNGEIFDQEKMTAAHPSLPMGTKAEVTNLENGKKIEVRINDRGPYVENRVIDLSSAAASKLEMKKNGVAQVKIEARPIKKKKSGTARDVASKRG